MAGFINLFRCRVDNLLASFLILSLIKRCFFSILIDGKIEKGYFLIVLGTNLLIASFYFFFKPRLGKIWLLFWSSLISVILLVNLWHFRYFQFPFSSFELLQVTNLSGLGPSILQQIRWIDIVFILDIILLAFIKSESPKSDLKGKITKFCAVLLIGLVLISVKPVKINLTQHLTLNQMVYFLDKTQSMLTWTAVVYTFIDTCNYFTDDRKLVLSDGENRQIQNWFKKNRDTYYSGNQTNKYSGIGSGKNLIVIQVESLESFVLQNKVNGQEITPNLNKLLKNSIYFTDLWPDVKGGNSSDAELLFNTSLYPVKEGSTFYRFPFNTYNSLAGMLKNQGYNSFALHGDRGSFWNRKQAYPSLGFQKFYDLSNFVLDEKIGMGLSDQSFFKQSLKILEAEKQPYFAYFITLSSHIPFDIPDSLKALKINEDLGIAGNYLQSIHYTDSAVGMFIKELAKRNMLKNTLIVIYGDHPGLTESDAQAAANSFGNINYLRDRGKVPFIIYNPSIKAEKFQHFGRQVDMMPTVADLLGIEPKKFNTTAMGRDLLKPENQKPDDGRDEDANLSDLILRSDYFKQKTILALQH